MRFVFSGIRRKHMTELPLIFVMHMQDMA